jgi:hypothetical protein
MVDAHIWLTARGGVNAAKWSVLGSEGYKKGSNVRVCKCATIITSKWVFYIRSSL